MNTPLNDPELISSVAEFHSILGLQAPINPLVSIVPLAGLRFVHPVLQKTFRQNFYSFALLYDYNDEIDLSYGDDYYYVNSGNRLICVSAGQVQKLNNASNFETKGFVFAIHADFFLYYLPTLNMKEYEFFSYSVNEGLVLTEEENLLIRDLFNNVEQEILNNTDKFANALVASHVDLLLNYCQRFYNRQFISLQEKSGNQLMQRLEEILENYFESKSLQEEGLPSVQYISDKMKFSPNYLSDMLRASTGKSTNQHIQDKAIEKAKQLLYKTNLSIAEIAYSFGYEYPQNFNKFFKRNTRISPQKYRHSVRNNP